MQVYSDGRVFLKNVSAADGGQYSTERTQTVQRGLRRRTVQMHGSEFSIQTD